MKKGLFIFVAVLILCLLTASSLFSATKTRLTKSFVKSAKKHSLLNTEFHEDASSYLKTILGIKAKAGNDLQVLHQHVDNNNQKYLRYQQTYQGIPIWGHQIVVKIDQANEIKNLNGTLVTGISKDIKFIKKESFIAQNEALQIAKTDHKTKHPEILDWFYENEKATLVVYLDHKNEAHICFDISFFTDSRTKAIPARPQYLIEAESGLILKQFDRLKYYTRSGAGPGGNLKVGQTSYNQNLADTFSVDFKYFDGCTMDTSKVQTINLNNGTSGTTPYQFDCTSANRTNDSPGNINGAYCPINDAQFFGEVVYDMYKAYTGESPLGGTSKIRLRVHYANNYVNAFWDGTYASFGDGNETLLYPLVSLDVVSHEIGHGYSDRFSETMASTQRQAMNESFSDISGEAAEYYLTGRNDFKLGYAIVKDPNGAMRYLDDPPADGSSIDNARDFYEGINFYRAAGVFNKAFYLLSTSDGWDVSKAFKAFAWANKNYWTPQTDFTTGAESVYEAAKDLGYQKDAVKTAFRAVGVLVRGDDVYAHFEYETSFMDVQFTDKSGSAQNGVTNWEWDFGDGNTSNLQNPQHTYMNSPDLPKTYPVTLTVTDAAGNESDWVEDVTVSDDYCDSYTNNCSEEWISQVEIGEVQHSSGASNYSDFTSNQFIFQIGNTYHTNFTASYCNGCTTRNELWGVWIDLNLNGTFSEEEKVFDGYGANTLSGQISIPNTVNPVVTRMRVSMSGGATLNPCGKFSWGEVEDYTVQLVSPGIVADFSVEKSGLKVIFTNNSSIPQDVSTVNWEWDFGDGTTSTLREPGFHIYESEGTYTVVLKAEDANSPSNSDEKRTTIDVLNQHVDPNFNVSIVGRTEVAFDNQTLIPAGQTVSSWIWNFGDRSPLCYDEHPANHVYPDTNTYNVTLTVVDSNSNEYSVSKPVGFYCTSQSGDSIYEHISGVEFVDNGNIIFSNRSGESNYSDFIAQVIPLNRNQSYQVNLDATFPSGEAYRECWALWVDFNQDGSFDDTTEKMIDSCVVGDYSQSVTIPPSAQLGRARARLTMKYQQEVVDRAPTPCEAFEYGEVEDYTIEIFE